ncbi:MAG: hypothetical protein JWN48_5875, partial [Myxococcaceae bacterium]|nr:hypothetical protein [Myxococcaceae bacterium]
MSLLDEARAELEALTAQNRAFMKAYPGDRAARQPVHTVYGGAQLYKADTTQRLGELALQSMDTYGRDPVEFAAGLGLMPRSALYDIDPEALRQAFEQDEQAMRRSNPGAWRAVRVYDRVREKLRSEPVEDFRIDFEDGFGARPDEEEDAVARAAA